METYANSPSCDTDQHVRLRDGRRLGYAEYGAADGKPVFFFHGMPGSRLFCHPDGSIPRALGMRIIAPDRPGIGLSDDKPGYRFLPGEGHLLFFSYWRDILTVLTSDSPSD
jgi:pimeloyl-ACP methyl ester carboxylesterase